MHEAISTNQNVQKCMKMKCVPGIGIYSARKRTKRRNKYVYQSNSLEHIVQSVDILFRAFQSADHRTRACVFVIQ